MANTPISQVSQAPLTTDYDLRDAFRLLKKEIFLELNCHAVGTIQSFVANTTQGSSPPVVGQTATATINYQRTFYKQNPTTQANEAYLVPYPLLVDCPVICIGGGGAALTFPIAAGDECLVLFNDRNLDNWFVSNSGGAVSTARMHSFTDAIILVGLRSAAHVIKNYSTAYAELRNGDPTTSGASVAVSPSHVKIYNNLHTLNTLLQSLVTAIKAITVGPGTFNIPATGSVVGISGTPINSASLTSIANQISDLLE